MSNAADRMREYRRRKRAGMRLCNVVVDDVLLERALIEFGSLNERDVDDPAAIERALTAMIEFVIEQYGNPEREHQ